MPTPASQARESRQISRIAGRLVRHLLRRWERGYSYGWDDALEIAIRDISNLLRSTQGQFVPKSELQQIADRLAHEAAHPK